MKGLVEAGIINAHSGKVKLFARSELPIDWDPISDSRLTVWETTQHLIMAIEDKGEASAAELLSKIGSGMGDNARDLAYRLYSICERKKWSQEALAYNSLIKSWPEITNLVKASTRQKKAQRTLFNEEGS
jgi:putative DNA methylase